jgi:hypothetical protein
MAAPVVTITSPENASETYALSLVVSGNAAGNDIEVATYEMDRNAGGWEELPADAIVTEGNPSNFKFIIPLDVGANTIQVRVQNILLETGTSALVAVTRQASASSEGNVRCQALRCPPLRPVSLRDAA